MLTLNKHRRDLHLHRLEHIHHSDHARQCREHSSQKDRAECESRITIVSGRHKKSGNVKSLSHWSALRSQGSQVVAQLEVWRTIFDDWMPFHIFHFAVGVCFVAGSNRSFDCRLVNLAFLVSRSIFSIACTVPQRRIVDVAFRRICIFQTGSLDVARHVAIGTLKAALERSRVSQAMMAQII